MFGKKVAVVVLVIGLLSLALGGFFIQQGFAKANMIAEKMAELQVTYSGAGGTIDGLIDTPREAQAMADILQEHSNSIGYYSQLPKDDPKRAQILQALTMIDSLQLAVMGFGLTDVVKASGAFMVLVGFTFVLISVPNLRQRKQLVQ